MTTSLRAVVQAMRGGHAALVGEIAGYLVLLAADCAALCPTYADADSVLLDADGAVRLMGRPATPEEAERSLRVLLQGLLRELRSPAPNLERVAAREDSRGLATLVVELEAALVPVNRRAAKRSLARLFRETARFVALEGTKVQVRVPSPVAAPVASPPVAPVAPRVAVPVAAPPAVPVASPVGAPVASPPATPVASLPAPLVASPPAAPVASPVVEVAPQVAVAVASPVPTAPVVEAARASSPPPPRASSVPPPLPPRVPLVRAALAAPLTLTPPPAPFQQHLDFEPRPRPSVPPVSMAVARAMLSVAGGSASPEPPLAEAPSRPEEGEWVEEEDVLTEFWAGASVVASAEPLGTEPAAESAAPAVSESAAPAAESLEPAVSESFEPASALRTHPVATMIEDALATEVELVLLARAAAADAEQGLSDTGPAFGERLEEASPAFASPLPTEAKTPLRISTFPIALAPEPVELPPDLKFIEHEEPPQRRPSDVSDLLSQMNVTPGSRGELYRGLLGLSRVEASPDAPPVAWAASGRD